MEAPHDSRDFIHPEPHDTLVLHLQHSHRSQVVWNEPQNGGVIICQRSAGLLYVHVIDDRFIPYLRVSGFYKAVRQGFFQLNHHLIIVLVDRWRSETHTSLLLHGECTITLQDIWLISGLLIDGKTITGSTGQPWQMLCHDLLGIVPDQKVMKGNSIIVN